MLAIPIKPKFYITRHAVVFSVFVVIGYLIRISDFGYSAIVTGLLSLSLIYTLNNLLFSGYKQEKRDYDEAIYKTAWLKHEAIRAEAEKERLKHSQVNENIQRQLEKLKIRKANAKPWQFWI